MLRTKEDFDRHLNAVVAKVMAQQASQDLYNYLVDQYKFNNHGELEFLAKMPYDQGRAWVDKTFAEYMEFHEQDPETWPDLNPIQVVETMRAYRKQRNAKIRAEKKSQTTSD